MRAALLCLVNRQRSSRRLPSLHEDPRLDRSAQGWTAHMVATGQFSHGHNFAGRISATGGSVAKVYRHVRRAATVTLRVPLSGAGRNRHSPFSTRVRIGFVPSSRGEHASVAFIRLRF